MLYDSLAGQQWWIAGLEKGRNLDRCLAHPGYVSRQCRGYVTEMDQRKICIDCADRIDEVATFEQWQAIGLPATGFSVCKEFCYCQLVEESVEIDGKVILD